jgi:hypothetical protein
MNTGLKKFYKRRAKASKIKHGSAPDCKTGV